PPIVVIGTTRDPATPHEWADALSEQLDSGVLISYDGDGHTAYGGVSACVDDAVKGSWSTGWCLRTGCPADRALLVGRTTAFCSPVRAPGTVGPPLRRLSSVGRAIHS